MFIKYIIFIIIGYIDIIRKIIGQGTHAKTIYFTAERRASIGKKSADKPGIG